VFFATALVAGAAGAYLLLKPIPAQIQAALGPTYWGVRVEF